MARAADAADAARWHRGGILFPPETPGPYRGARRRALVKQKTSAAEKAVKPRTIKLEAAPASGCAARRLAEQVQLHHADFAASPKLKVANLKHRRSFDTSRAGQLNRNLF